MSQRRSPRQTSPSPALFHAVQPATKTYALRQTRTVEAKREPPQQQQQARLSFDPAVTRDVLGMVGRVVARCAVRHGNLATAQVGKVLQAPRGTIRVQLLGVVGSHALIDAALIEAFGPTARVLCTEMGVLCVSVPRVRPLAAPAAARSRTRSVSVAASTWRAGTPFHRRGGEEEEKRPQATQQRRTPFLLLLLLAAAATALYFLS